jgi:hypothetical protein
MSDLDNLAAAFRAVSRAGYAPPTLVAVGWATVDAERAAAEQAGIEFVATEPEEALGARAWLGRNGWVDVVLLEPSTEGRLAAALARRGEGLAVLYLAVDGLDGATRMTALGRPGRLLPHGKPWGPFIILVGD